MNDLDPLVPMLPAPKSSPRLGEDVPAPEWHSLAWRPAGALLLAERWLRAGEGVGPGTPPKLNRRR